MVEKNKMNFKSEDELKKVCLLIDDADKALNDKSRTMKDSIVKEAFLDVKYETLSTPGHVTAAGIGSGLVAGIGASLMSGVVPVVALGGIGATIYAHNRNKRFEESKMLLYKEALAKQTEILKALWAEQNADKDRIDYLTELNNYFQEIIIKLNDDLANAR